MATTGFTGFPEDLFGFLEELSVNNNRDWFTANKSRYRDSVVEPVADFIGAMGGRLEKISGHFVADPRTNGGSMFRIYRDTRFSKDKRPYKENVGCHFRHAAGRSAHAPGFYLHLQPGRVFAGAGVWMPDARALDRIRSAIVEKPDAWRQVISDRKLRKRFHAIEGDTLKRMPRGYADDAPHAEDLKRKSFFVTCPFEQTLALTPGFIGEVAKVYADAAPLVRFMTGALELPF
jgi:uncharacterized protein (TIGR02453 family)